MCNGGRSPGGVTEALGMLDRALACLASADVAALPSAAQAEALRALGRAEARHTAARARMLTAFAAQGGYEDDGHGTARTWLKWQTRVTTGAAAAHPGVRSPSARPAPRKVIPSRNHRSSNPSSSGGAHRSYIS